MLKSLISSESFFIKRGAALFTLSFQVKQSIDINCPRQQCFDFLANFMNWPNWSPWLNQESNCDFSVGGKPGTIGHKQVWKGKYIGSGQMTINEIDSGKSLSYLLEMEKPWKSKSRVSLDITNGEAEQGTTVTWSMQGSLPFFLFFLKKLMIALITSDYKRGLSMLKEHLEKSCSCKNLTATTT